jgi:tetrahydromethanopterin S-methyltransferase subunit G
MPSSPTTELEKTSLEAHVDLCALRYGQLEKRLTTIEEKVETLQQTVQNSHNSMIKVIIGTAGTVVTGVLSVLVVILTKMS